MIPLQWRHNGQDGVSNHQPHDCLLNRLLSADLRKHESSPPLAFVQVIHRGPVNYPHKRASNAENVSIWWRHHITGLVPNRPRLMMAQFDDACMCHETSFWWRLITIAMTSQERHIFSNQRFNSSCRPTSKKHQSLPYWPGVRGIHQWPVIYPHKGPVRRKKLSFYDVNMTLPLHERPLRTKITDNSTAYSHSCWHQRSALLALCKANPPATCVPHKGFPCRDVRSVCVQNLNSARRNGVCQIRCVMFAS